MQQRDKCLVPWNKTQQAVTKILEAGAVLLNIHMKHYKDYFKHLKLELVILSTKLQIILICLVYKLVRKKEYSQFLFSEFEE